MQYSQGHQGHAMHPLAIYLLLFPLAAQADIYKCFDHTGKVTYTNSACAKSGLKEAKLIPPPPPPAIDKPARLQEAEKPVAGKAQATDDKPKQQTAALQVMQSTKSNGTACGKLNSDLGRIMDEMDAARSRGATAAQQLAWDKSLDELKTEKNRLGCF